MRRALDTNVLLYAHLPAFPEHLAVRTYLLSQLGAAGVSLVLTPLVLHEFLQVVTDARRFSPPLNMDQALAVVRGYLGKANVEIVPLDEEAVRLALLLLERHRLGRKRIADAPFAAALIAQEVPEIVTCNVDDFAPLSELVVIDPRTAGVAG